MKIYTKHFGCVICKKIVGEYSEKNKERNVRSWTSVCLKCFKKYLTNDTEL